ncbi:hypothetical protein Tco_1105140 [Tanacetum coccineum]
MHVHGLAAAASRYHRVLDENQKLDYQVQDLKGNDVMEEKYGSTTICFVSFLPDILDYKAEGRNNSVWDAAGKQPSLENHIGVGGYGYPALIALNKKKGVHTPRLKALLNERKSYVGHNEYKLQVKAYLQETSTECEEQIRTTEPDK